MADDWIKIRTDIYRDPKVCLMAEHLESSDGDLARYVRQNKQRDMAVTRNVTRHAIVGCLVTVWGVIRHRGKRECDNATLPGVTVNVLDDIADIPGFGEAMESVGWVEQTEEGIVFPNYYGNYNSEPSSSKAMTALERQRNCRTRKRHEKCHENVTTVTGKNRDMSRDVTTEKSREEKSRDKSKTHTETFGDSPAAAIPSEPTADAVECEQDAADSMTAAHLVMTSWNAVGPVRSSRLNDKLRSSIKARLRTPWWAEHWLKALEKVPECPFLCGQGERGWKADLAWFLKPNSVQEILDGKYDGTFRQQQPTAKPTRTDSTLSAIERWVVNATGGSDGVCEDNRPPVSGQALHRIE